MPLVIEEVHQELLDDIGLQKQGNKSIVFILQVIDRFLSGIQTWNIVYAYVLICFSS